MRQLDVYDTVTYSTHIASNQASELRLALQGLGVSMHPGYVLNGKTYKTVNGLLTAIDKDATKRTGMAVGSISMVDSKGFVTVWGMLGSVVAKYSVSPPKLGETQTVTPA